MIGYDAELTFTYGSSPTSLGCVTMITAPELSVDSVETTCLGMATPHKTFEPGLIDSGEVTFEANYSATVWDACNEVLLARETVPFTLTDPSGFGQTYTFD